MRGQRLCDEQQPRRVLVDAMDDASARDFLESRRVVQQAVHQGAAGIACSGVYHQPGGLVDDQQVFVLENDVEGYGLR